MATSVKKPPESKGEKDTGKKSIAKDAELVAGLILAPIYSKPGGIQKLVKVVQGAKDPADALAHAIFAVMSQARNAIIKNKIPINPKAWIANGGAVDKVIIDLGGLLASTAGKQYVDKKFGQQVKMDLIKIMHQEETASGGPGHPGMQPQPPAGPPQGGPGLMAPQGAGPQGPPPDVTGGMG